MLGNSIDINIINNEILIDDRFVNPNFSLNHIYLHLNKDFYFYHYVNYKINKILTKYNYFNFNEHYDIPFIDNIIMPHLKNNINKINKNKNELCALLNIPKIISSEIINCYDIQLKLINYCMNNEMYDVADYIKQINLDAGLLNNHNYLIVNELVRLIKEKFNTFKLSEIFYDIKKYKTYADLFFYVSDADFVDTPYKNIIKQYNVSIPLDIIEKIINNHHDPNIIFFLKNNTEMFINNKNIETEKEIIKYDNIINTYNNLSYELCFLKNNYKKRIKYSCHLNNNVFDDRLLYMLEKLNKKYDYGKIYISFPIKFKFICKYNILPLISVRSTLHNDEKSYFHKWTYNKYSVLFKNNHIQNINFSGNVKSIFFMLKFYNDIKIIPIQSFNIGITVDNNRVNMLPAIYYSIDDFYVHKYYLDDTYNFITILKTIDMHFDFLNKYSDIKYFKLYVWINSIIN